MGKAWEGRDEADLKATPEQVWQAIATGPGIDSWYMGRSTVEPWLGGAISTDVGPFVMQSKVTAWEPGKRLAHRSDETADGRFIAFEYLIEAQEHGSTVLRLVANGFLPGDDWDAEYEAMLRGGQMYFGTLVACLTHFTGRTATPIGAAGPSQLSWTDSRAKLCHAMGLAGEPSVGDRVRVHARGSAGHRRGRGLRQRRRDRLCARRTRFTGSSAASLDRCSHSTTSFLSDVDAHHARQAWQRWLYQTLV
jgi:uncharacterized protein YndB with AHSA1/START domain